MICILRSFERNTCFLEERFDLSRQLPDSFQPDPGIWMNFIKRGHSLIWIVGKRAKFE